MSGVTKKFIFIVHRFQSLIFIYPVLNVSFILFFSIRVDKNINKSLVTNDSKANTIK